MYIHRTERYVCVYLKGVLHAIRVIQNSHLRFDHYERALISYVLSPPLPSTHLKIILIIVPNYYAGESFNY